MWLETSGTIIVSPFLRKTLSTATGLTSTQIIDQFIQPFLDETQVENFYYQKKIQYYFFFL